MLAAIEQNGDLRKLIGSGRLERGPDAMIMVFDGRDPEVVKEFGVLLAEVKDLVTVVCPRTLALEFLRENAPESARVVAGSPPEGYVWVVAYTRQATTVAATLKTFDRHMPQAFDPITNPN